MLSLRKGWKTQSETDQPTLCPISSIHPHPSTMCTSNSAPMLNLTWWTDCPLLLPNEDVPALHLGSRATHNTLQIAECSEATSNGMWSAVTQHKKLLLWESTQSEVQNNLSFIHHMFLAITTLIKARQPKMLGEWRIRVCWRGRVVQPVLILIRQRWLSVCGEIYPP